MTLCLSNGVPMITAGDERGRTQGGNNNPYVQDNEISWVDWRADDAWLDVYEITKAALRLRREHPALRQRHWFEGRPTIEGGPQGPDLAAPERPRDDRRRLGGRRAVAWSGCCVTGDPLRSPGPRGEQQWDSSFLIWLNAEAEPVKVTMPADGLGRPGEVVVSTCPDHPDRRRRVERGRGAPSWRRGSVVVVREDARGSRVAGPVPGSSPMSARARRPGWWR